MKNSISIIFWLALAATSISCIKAIKSSSADIKANEAGPFVLTLQMPTLIKAEKTYNAEDDEVASQANLVKKQPEQLGLFYCILPAKTQITVTQPVYDEKIDGHYHIRGISKIEVPIEADPAILPVEPVILPDEGSSEDQGLPNTILPDVTEPLTNNAPLASPQTKTLACPLHSGYVYAPTIELGAAERKSSDAIGPKTKRFLNEHLKFRGTAYVAGGTSYRASDCTGSIIGAMRNSLGVTPSSVYFENDPANFVRVNCATECRPGVIASHNSPYPHSWVMQKVVTKNGKGGNCADPGNRISQVANGRTGFSEGRIPGWLMHPSVCVIPRVIASESKSQ